MKMTESQRLLADYVTNGSEGAFRELVTRYTDLVYSTAIRLVCGDSQLAQEVCQTVFIDLARKAQTISGEVMIGGWLHRHTRFVAATLMRGERRRQSRERQAAEMNALRNEPGCNLAWASLQVDEAIDTLATEDRTALVLRFFEQADLHSVGVALGISENAARMRVTRALDKLHSILGRRGATLSVTALAAALGAEAVTAAPTGLAASLAATALAGGIANATTLTFIKTIGMAKLKCGIIGALAVVAVATPLTLQRHSLTRLREENQSLRQQLEEQLAIGRNQQANTQPNVAQPVEQDHLRELLRLRGEVGLLKRQLAETTTAAERSAKPAQMQLPDDPQEREKQLAMARLNYPKYWMIAFFEYAQQNQDQCPTNFDQALSFLPDKAREQTNLGPDQFEIVYQGSLKDLTNGQSLIVIREREAVAGNGGWWRAYGFADGHSELHKAEDGNFEPWEAKHFVAAPANLSGQ
jgi:RNA polymerase sigma factor (sigma-70 family)